MSHFKLQIKTRNIGVELNGVSDEYKRRILRRSTFCLFHQTLDVRINELERQGFRDQEIDAWIGNTEAVRNKHYSATSVTKADRQKALGITGAAKSVGIVYAENTQSDPNHLVEELLKSGKGRELLEIIQKALIQASLK